jgi:hypothetical protein
VVERYLNGGRDAYWVEVMVVSLVSMAANDWVLHTNAFHHQRRGTTPSGHGWRVV